LIEIEVRYIEYFILECVSTFFHVVLCIEQIVYIYTKTTQFLFSIDENKAFTNVCLSRWYDLSRISKFIYIINYFSFSFDDESSLFVMFLSLDSISSEFLVFSLSLDKFTIVEELSRGSRKNEIGTVLSLERIFSIENAMCDGAEVWRNGDFGNGDIGVKADLPLLIKASLVRTNL